MPYLIDGTTSSARGWPGRAGRRPGRGRTPRRHLLPGPGARAVLVFDGVPFRPISRDSSSGRLAPLPHGGRDADTVIREIVDGASRPAELVVVTSDRPLYSYARTRGAQVLRAHEWNALARAAKPQAPHARGEKPEHETDVEGWLKRFSRE